MPYATQSDLESRFGQAEVLQRADRDLDGEPDEGVVAGALADADQLINGFVAGRYKVPLSPVPDIIVQLACDIARYRLHAELPTETIRQNYKDALARLADVQAGRLVLQAAGVETGAASPGQSEVLQSGPGRMFDASTMGGF